MQMATQVSLVPGSPVGGVDETPSFRGFLRSKFMRFILCQSFWFGGIPVTLHSKEFPSSQLAQSHLHTWITLKWGTAMGEGTACDLQCRRSCWLETNPV